MVRNKCAKKASKEWRKKIGKDSGGVVLFLVIKCAPSSEHRCSAWIVFIGLTLKASASAFTPPSAESCTQRDQGPAKSNNLGR